MGPITRIIPKPKRLPFGGAEVLVGELRLSDLADLQSWLDSKWTDPMDEIRLRLPGASSEERRKMLVSAYEKAELGPPTWGDARSEELLATGEGMLALLRVILARYHPDLSTETIAELAVRSNAGEYLAIQRAAFGVRGIEEIARLLGIDDRPEGRPVDWPEAICQVCQAYGWTLRDVYSLTMSEFVHARCAGKPPDLERPLRKGEDWKAMVREQRRRFYGPEGGM